MSIIPDLEKSNRSREFESYSEIEKAEVVYEYLFVGISHRKLDEQTLGLSSSYSRGWQSMGILHYLGIKDSFKGFFSNVGLVDAITQLSSRNKDYKLIAYYLSLYNSGRDNDNDLMHFRQNLNVEPLLKKVGSSQYTDGVRIDKSYHEIFNPPASKYFTERGGARSILVLFNNRIFSAVYRYEGQVDEGVELQSIRFKKELKSEFKEVFPHQTGDFSIALGNDLNHFLFVTKGTDAQEFEDGENYPEGRISYRTHRVYERNPKVVKKAKKLYFNKHGFYSCEVCGFRFDLRYGARGKDFIEGHHKKLVSEMKPGEKTNPRDIALLCSNCHRMIHRKPLMSVDGLRKEYNK